MEECKAEVEKKVSVLVDLIQNNNKIPDVAKKELLGVANDLDEQFQLLCSDLGSSGRKGAFGTVSSSRCSSDLDYYSSEEFDMDGDVDYAAMLRKMREAELTNEDLKRQVGNLKEETEFLRDQNMELAGDMGGKRNEDRLKFMTKAEAALLLSQKEHLERQLEEETKEHQDVIRRLSMETEDQQKHVQEQKATIDKLSEVQKLMNTNLLERKMEEQAQDFQMKIEDQLRILYRRIHVAEQLHLESKANYVNTQPRENRETQFEKMKEMVEKGLAGPEMAIKKVEEGGELVTRVTRLTKEIHSVQKWVHDKNNKTKHEVETLEAKLECREAQESLLKEKLSKLEAKLGQEGTGKLSVAKAMKRIKKLEINVKEKDLELLSLGEEKREAIRQLCVLVDYQRCRYADLKTSIFKLALQA